MGVRLIRTLVADDTHLTLRGLVAILAGEGDIDVVAEVDRGDQLLPTAISQAPEVAVINSNLPGMDGYTAARLLAERVPACRTLVMAEQPRVSDLRRVVEAGAWGLIMKQTSAISIATAIRQVASGQKVVDPDLAFAALDAQRNPLTRREAEVLHLTALGTPVHEIAKELHLTIGTVRNYLTRILRKVGARNRVDAIRIAHEEDWI